MEIKRPLRAVYEGWENHLKTFDIRNNYYMCGPTPTFRLEQGIEQTCVPFECGSHFENTSIGQDCSSVLARMYEAGKKKAKLPSLLLVCLKVSSSALPRRPNLDFCAKRFEQCDGPDWRTSRSCCSRNQACLSLEDADGGENLEGVAICKETFKISSPPGINAGQVGAESPSCPSSSLLSHWNWGHAALE